VIARLAPCGKLNVAAIDQDLVGFGSYRLTWHISGGFGTSRRNEVSRLAERNPEAFWSYARSDDEHPRGKLSDLRQRLQSEVKAQLGSDFNIFQDTIDLKWGAQWQQKILDSLLETVFLIPVMTPTFFTSSACRIEIETFRRREEKLLDEELILPVYWIPVERPGDELAKLIMSRKYMDLRDLRFEPIDSPVFGKRISAMAEQVISRLKDFELRQRRVSNMKAEIRAPRRNDYVGRNPTVVGTIDNVPAGLTPRLVVQGGRRYHPQAIISEREWKATATLGGQGFGASNDSEYPIHVVVATRSANDAFERYSSEQMKIKAWPGLPLPDGARILCTALVRRNDHNNAAAQLIGSYDEHRALPMEPTGGTIKITASARGDLSIAAINSRGDTEWTGAITIGEVTGQVSATYRYAKGPSQGTLELRQSSDQIEVTGKDKAAPARPFRMIWKKRRS
jgi:hypothetical protein